MRIACPLMSIAVAVALLAGCGSSSSEQSQTRPQQSPTATESSAAPPGASVKTCDTHAVDAKALRVTGVSCGQARLVMYGWQRHDGCSAPAGASRHSCTVRDFRCLGARAESGIAVSCATEGRSLSFVAKRG